MRIFRIFRVSDGTQITTRNNRYNLYTRLVDAKVALKNFLRHQKPNKPKIDSEDCIIIEFDLVEKDRHGI